MSLWMCWLPARWLAVVDIDHFKSVNDTHGHPAGDAVLRRVAQRLSTQVRTVDRIARYGGEEFALVLVQTDRRAALEVASRIVATVAAHPVPIDGGLELPLTVSAGLAVLPADAKHVEQLISAADRALYAAKKGGRNRVVAFHELNLPGEVRE